MTTGAPKSIFVGPKCSFGASIIPKKSQLKKSRPASGLPATYGRPTPLGAPQPCSEPYQLLIWLFFHVVGLVKLHLRSKFGVNLIHIAGDTSYLMQVYSICLVIYQHSLNTGNRLSNGHISLEMWYFFVQLLHPYISFARRM